MIPFGILSSSRRRGSGPPIIDPPGEISLVQEWPVAIGTSNASGPEITAGNLVIIRAIHRGGSSGRPAMPYDNGPNVWIPAGQAVAGGSGDVYMWYCENATAFNLALVEIDEDPDVSRIIFVSEWTGAATSGALIDSTSIDNPSGLTPAPALVNATEGALVTGTLGATISNRVFTLQTPNYVAGLEHRAQQTTLISAFRAGVPEALHGPQWNITSGSSSTSGAITAAFRPA